MSNIQVADTIVRKRLPKKLREGRRMVREASAAFNKTYDASDGVKVSVLQDAQYKLRRLQAEAERGAGKGRVHAYAAYVYRRAGTRQIRWADQSGLTLLISGKDRARLYAKATGTEEPSDPDDSLANL